MAPLDLAGRRLLPERMDEERVAPDDLDACLRELERINRLSCAYAPTLGWLDRLAAAYPEGPLRVVDVACGRGDMLRRIAAWARRRARPVVLTGIDLNPVTIGVARAATPDTAITFRVADAFALPADLEADAIVSSLFAHHLDDDGVVRFLRTMEARARCGWFVNDLHRNAVPYWTVRALALLPWHRFVKSDAPISVGRGFTRADWTALLHRSGLEAAAQVRWHLPFRLCVGRIR